MCYKNFDLAQWICHTIFHTSHRGMQRLHLLRYVHIYFYGMEAKNNNNWKIDHQT